MEHLNLVIEVKFTVLAGKLFQIFITRSQKNEERMLLGHSKLWLTKSHRHHVTIAFIVFPLCTVRDRNIFLKRSSGPLPLRYSGV